MFFLIPSLCWADYVCSKKETPMPTAQRELFARAVLAMRAALLPPPEGWTMNQPTVRSPNVALCIDFKNAPLVFSASTSYVARPTAEAQRRYHAAQVAQRKEIEALRKYPADVQTKLDAFREERLQLRKEAREAERAKHSELSKAKYAQAEEISRKSDAVANEYSMSIQPKEREIYKKYEPDIALNRSIMISVSLLANDAVQPNAGGSNDLVFGSTAKTNQATDKVVRISASVDARQGATPEQIALVKGLIDAAKLKAIVSGNIPSAEESQALISKQNEVIATLDTKARELERAIEIESRRAEEAEQIAQRQAAEAEKAGKTRAPVTAKADTPAEKADAPAASTTVSATPKPATPPTSTPPAQPATNPADTVKDAKEAVNKLRGLFGK
jgi:hypothetical protein